MSGYDIYRIDALDEHDAWRDTIRPGMLAHVPAGAHVGGRVSVDMAVPAAAHIANKSAMEEFCLLNSSSMWPGFRATLLRRNVK